MPRKLLVRKGGVEPPWVAPPDPKSGASANSATFARVEHPSRRGLPRLAHQRRETRQAPVWRSTGDHSLDSKLPRLQRHMLNRRIYDPGTGPFTDRINVWVGPFSRFFEKGPADSRVHWTPREGEPSFT